MPAQRRSLIITDAYRVRLAQIRRRVETAAALRFPSIDQLDDTDFPQRMATVMEAAQREAVRASGGYLAAFVSSELGRRTAVVAPDSRRYAGLSRDGRPLTESLESPLVAVKAKLAEGVGPVEATEYGRNRAVRMASVDFDHAHRTALLDAIEEGDRFEGWQRAMRGTCGACAGVATGATDGLQFQVHPGCQCVSEPVIRPHFKPARSKDGDTLTTARAIFQQKEEFEALSDDAIIEVYHGAAGIAGAPVEAAPYTYVTPNWYIARGYGGGKDPLVLRVRKGDLRPSPESLSAFGKNATSADSLFDVGEAVVPRETLGNLRPTGQQLFASKTKVEQDEMLGAEAAEQVRTGAIELSDLVDKSPLATQPDFITQKPVPVAVE